MGETRGMDAGTITVPMVDPEIARQIRALDALGWGAKRIARELGIARNSVRWYVRLREVAETQERPGTRTLTPQEEEEDARGLLDGPAAGNAVVVRRLLAEPRHVNVPLRPLQRRLTPHRQQKRAAEAATVRFETAPGHQTQIDFGEKWIFVAGVRTKEHLFAAVLGYSRRIFAVRR